MSLGLLTALLLFGTSQNAKPPELPMNPNVTCAAEPGDGCDRGPASDIDRAVQTLTPGARKILEVRGKAAVLVGLSARTALGLVHCQFSLFAPRWIGPKLDWCLAVDWARFVLDCLGLDGKMSPWLAKHRAFSSLWCKMSPVDSAPGGQAAVADNLTFRAASHQQISTASTTTLRNYHLSFAPQTVGRIVIFGGSATKQREIREKFPLHPGDEFTWADLRTAETKFAQLDLFEAAQAKETHPTVEVIDPDGDNRVKDILITVVEKAEAPPMPGLVDASDASITADQSASPQTGCYAADNSETLDEMPNEQAPESSPMQDGASKPATVGQVILIDNEGRITVSHKVTTGIIIQPVSPLPGQPDLRRLGENVLKVSVVDTEGETIVRPLADFDDVIKDLIVSVDETAIGGLIFGVGALTGCYAMEESETLDAMPKEEAPENSPCPYLRQKAQKPTTPEPCVVETVMDKLDQLKRARASFRKAERCRRTGDLEAAATWYQQARQVCPHSPLDGKIAGRMKKLDRQRAALEKPTKSKEARPGACHQADPLPCGKPAAVDAEVAELVEACQRAMADGDYPGAAAQVYQALLLDPDSIAVKALVDRLLEMEKNVSDEGGQEPSEAPPADTDSPPETTLEPSLPPVDPGIVEVLEKVLRQTGEPMKAKLVIAVEEPEEEAPDEQEEPLTQWRPGAPEVEAPSLLVDPEEEDSVLEDPDSEENNPAEPDEMPRAKLEKMLREACAAIEQGRYVDVEEGRIPGDCQRMQVGSVQCKWIDDGWGHRYLIVKLTPGMSSDLRSAPPNFYQRIWNWIFKQNNGGNSQEESETSADREDLDRLLDDLEGTEPDWEPAP